MRVVMVGTYQKGWGHKWSTSTPWGAPQKTTAKIWGKGGAWGDEKVGGRGGGGGGGGREGSKKPDMRLWAWWDMVLKVICRKGGTYRVKNAFRGA